MTEPDKPPCRWYVVGDRVVWSPVLCPVGWPQTQFEAVVLRCDGPVVLVRIAGIPSMAEPCEWWVGEEELTPAAVASRRLPKSERGREPLDAERLAKRLAYEDRKQARQRARKGKR